jgi:hypothetical protein
MINSRQWRDLLLRKRFGFGHNQDSQPCKGDLALFCPACPQPGINLPDITSADPKYIVNFLIHFLFSHDLQMVVSQKHCCGWKFFTGAHENEETWF